MESLNRHTCRGPRRGLSLLEGLVALMILSVGFVGLLSTSSGESRFTGMSREHFLAGQALRQLREAFRGQPRLAYQDVFPAAESDYEGNPLYATQINEHPLLLVPDHPELAPVHEAFETALSRAGIERRILYREMDSPEGTIGVVTYLVRFPRGDGVVRIQDVEVVHD